jgi:putative endonuclease
MDHRRGSGEGRRSTRALGHAGERLAARHLRASGARILARNVHLRHAEIDLVALERGALCIVEVRLRRGSGFGSGAESVDRRKRRRLVAAARELLCRPGLPRFERVRFDVIAIDASVDPPRVEHLRDAFSLDQI